MVADTIVATLLGCVGCQATVESLQTRIPDSLNLMTLMNFLFITVEGIIFESKFFSVPNKIPLRAYGKIVCIYFLVNVCNNYSLKFDVYFPLFIVFKSCTLLFHMILRYALLGQCFSKKQILSILIVTVGVAIFTLASYEPNNAMISRGGTWLHDLPIPPFVIGIFLLCIAVILSSYLGICQELLYREHGSFHKESMFYIHFLSIPMFALFGSDLGGAITAANNSKHFVLFNLEIPLPSAWLILITSAFFNWICVINVYRLSALTSSLNVNMVISLRKFISLTISFIIFSNPFNVFHLLGGIIVFIGTIMYTLAF